MGGVCGRSNDVVWRKNGFRMHKVATTDKYSVAKNRAQELVPLATLIMTILNILIPRPLPAFQCCLLTLARAGSGLGMIEVAITKCDCFPSY